MFIVVSNAVSQNSLDLHESEHKEY